MEEYLTFGQAIELLKQGHKVTRDGWNGKGMYIFLISAEANAHAISNFYSNGEDIVGLPSIGMYTTNSEGRRAFLNGWLASQTDILSKDWYKIEGTDNDK